MSEIRVYGASDDLIEVDGDICEEFSPGVGGSAYLAFDDGTVLRIKFDDDGFWRIHLVAAGSAQFSKTEATDEDIDYSDRVTLSGADFSWVVCGSGYAKSGAA